MKKLLLSLLSMAALAATASTLFAGATPTPTLKPEKDIIDTVTPDSLIVRHSVVKQGDKPGGKGAKIQVLNKYYTINKSTLITIDDATSTVDKLQKGMLVTVHAQTGTKTSPDAEPESIATEIIARTHK